MKIFIESGATKSTCIGYKGACTFFTYKTSGINATYATKESIKAIFEDIIAKNNIATAAVETIQYYGAGCFNINNAEKVKEVLKVLFPNANITVLSDLYAVCHTLCNLRSGFAGILGTGAASCFYDGKEITDRAPSLGFMLGDEGSGVHIGKMFTIQYLTEKIDPEIAQDFEKTFMVSKQKLFEKVYQEPNPQTFFAAIPVFLQKHIENQQIKTIIENSFQAFFNQQKEYYKTFSYPWFFCGSIAYYFQDILMEIAQKNDIKIAQVIRECAMNLVKT